MFSKKAATDQNTIDLLKQQDRNLALEELELAQKAFKRRLIENLEENFEPLPLSIIYGSEIDS